MTNEEIGERIAGYLHGELLDGERDLRIEPETPLLEWGVLNSMNTMRLLNFIREDLGVTVPPAMIAGRHFRNLAAISDLVSSLSAAES